MKFKHGDLVRLKDSSRMGRVVGFCPYTRHYEYSPTVHGQNVYEGVLVNLSEGFYDPTRTAFITIMVCQEDTLEDA